MRFLDKVILVTGAGQGMGRAIAQAFAREGACVAVSARTPTSGEDTLANIKAGGGRAFLACGDIADRVEVKSIVHRAAERYGRLDVIVHCAADSAHGLVADMPDETFDQLARCNVYSPFWLAKDALPYLSKAIDQGRLIYISSNGANRNFVPMFAPYASSKAFLNAFARNLAVEFGTANVLVNVIEPGLTATDRMLGKLGEDFPRAMASHFPVPRMGEPKDIAAAALFMASQEASYITGAFLLVDGGGSMVAPPRLNEALDGS